MKREESFWETVLGMRLIWWGILAFSLSLFIVPSCIIYSVTSNPEYYTMDRGNLILANDKWGLYGYWENIGPHPRCIYRGNDLEWRKIVCMSQDNEVVWEEE